MASKDQKWRPWHEDFLCGLFEGFHNNHERTGLTLLKCESKPDLAYLTSQGGVILVDLSRSMNLLDSKRFHQKTWKMWALCRSKSTACKNCLNIPSRLMSWSKMSRILYPNKKTFYELSDDELHSLGRF